jgi:hypothetical protein
MLLLRTSLPSPIFIIVLDAKPVALSGIVGCLVDADELSGQRVVISSVDVTQLRLHLSGWFPFLISVMLLFGAGSQLRTNESFALISAEW